MFPAATSTTMPSGSRRPSETIVRKSEPSGFAVITRPPPRSKRNSRPTVFLEPEFAGFELEFVEAMESFAPFSQSVLDRCLIPKRSGKSLRGNRRPELFRFHRRLQVFVSRQT